MLSSHMGPVAILLDRTDVEHAESSVKWTLALSSEKCSKVIYIAFFFKRLSKISYCVFK